MKKEWNAPQVEELKISATSMPGHGGHGRPGMGHGGPDDWHDDQIDDPAPKPHHPTRPIPPVEDEEGTDELS